MAMARQPGKRRSRKGKETTHLVLTSRAWSRSGVDMYSISLTESLPVIAIPLLQSEPDVALNLQAAFQKAYDGGPFRRCAVDYSQPPIPALEEAMESWRLQLIDAAAK